MSETEVKKCPKCDGEMEQGEFSQAHVMRHRFLKKGDLLGDEIIPFYCKNCGYIELYKETKKRRNARAHKK
jgi:predicted nucleic-acid-binding Zn-ribbon protein